MTERFDKYESPFTARVFTNEKKNEPAIVIHDVRIITWNAQDRAYVFSNPKGEVIETVSLNKDSIRRITLLRDSNNA